MLQYIYKRFENYDFIILALKVLGIDLYATQTKRIFKYPPMFIIPALISLSINMLSLYYSFQNMQEFGKVIHCIYMFVQGILVLLKISLLLMNARKFQKLIANIKYLTKGAERNELAVWRKSYVQQHKVICFYLLMCLITGTVYGLSPIMSTFYYFLKSGGEFQLTQPYWALFPTDFAFSPLVNYALSYMLFIPLAWFFLPSSFAIDALYCWYIFTISAHFGILQEKLRVLTHILQSQNFDLVKRKLNEFINYHCHVINLISDFQAIFEKILCAEILFCAFLICLLMSQVGIIVKMADLPFICLFMGAVTTQLAIFCLGGQILKNRSNDLNLSMNLPWYNLTPKWRHQLLLPIMRTQKGCTLMGIFFEVDNPLLVWIFKTSWSFSAFVMAMNEQT